MGIWGREDWGIDPDLPVTDEERRLIRVKAERLTREHGYSGLVVYIGTGCLAAGAAVVGSQWFGIAWALTVSILAATVGIVVGRLLIWGRVVTTMRQLVREQGLDVCLRCGYWIRGADRCPECGWEMPPGA